MSGSALPDRSSPPRVRQRRSRYLHTHQLAPFGADLSLVPELEREGRLCPWGWPHVFSAQASFETGFRGQLRIPDQRAPAIRSKSATIPDSIPPLIPIEVHCDGPLGAAQKSAGKDASR